MIVGFTGTQRGMSDAQKWAFIDAIKFLEPERFLHGDCIGADRDAHNLVRACWPPCKIITYPCTIHWKRAYCDADLSHEPAPPLERNEIIAQKCDVLIATPFEAEEVLRSGTWSTIRRARKHGKVVRILAR